MQTAEWLGGRREAFGSLAPCENLTTASDHVKYSYTLCSLRLLMCLFSPPHHHHRHPAPTLTEKICVHSCRPARWSESDWRGGRVKTQAGVPFCWPESGSSHVLLQHSQQHHTVRQKVKGRQVISHTHTHNTLLRRKKPTFFLHLPLHLPLSSLQPHSPAAAPNQPAFTLEQTTWRLTGLLSRLKQQQKKRGVIVALLNSSKDVGVHKPHVCLDHKGGWHGGK